MDILITDFTQFYACLEKASYISDDIIIDVTEAGVQINAKNMISRLSIESTSATSTEPCQIVLNDIKLLLVALSNANDSIKDAFADKLSVSVSKSKLLVKTRNSRTSLHQASPDIIQSQSTQISTLPKSIMTFTLNKQAFRKINSSLIYISNVNDARAEFGSFDEIEDKSMIAAKIFAANTPLSNHSVIAIGELNTMSDTPLNYQVTLDFDRITLLAKFVGESATIAALEKPALVVQHTTPMTAESAATTKTTFICSIVK